MFGCLYDTIKVTLNLHVDSAFEEWPISLAKYLRDERRLPGTKYKIEEPMYQNPYGQDLQNEGRYERGVSAMEGRCARREDGRGRLKRWTVSGRAVLIVGELA